MQVKSQASHTHLSVAPAPSKPCKARQRDLPSHGLSHLQPAPWYPFPPWEAFRPSILWRPVYSHATSTASSPRPIVSHCEWFIVLNVQPPLGHRLFSKVCLCWVTTRIRQLFQTSNLGATSEVPQLFILLTTPWSEETHSQRIPGWAIWDPAL